MKHVGKLKLENRSLKPTQVLCSAIVTELMKSGALTVITYFTVLISPLFLGDADALFPYFILIQFIHIFPGFPYYVLYFYVWMDGTVCVSIICLI